MPEGIRRRPENGDQIEVEPAKPELRTADTSRSPHVAKLSSDKSGPYYIAPDSAEPLPSGMWADLDPDAVEEQAAELNAELERDQLSPTEVTPGVRELLEDNGEVGQKLLETLERGAKASTAAPNAE